MGHYTSEPPIRPQERIGEALDSLRQGLEPFIDREMRKAHGKDWATAVSFATSPNADRKN